MAVCVSRLQEALNLLPRTGTQSLGENIAATLSARSAGRSVPRESKAIQSPHDGEQQDLRQQQVHNPLDSTILVLRSCTRFISVAGCRARNLFASPLVLRVAWCFVLTCGVLCETVAV